MNSENLFPFGLPIKILKIAGIWQRKSSSWTYFCYGIIMHFNFIELFTLLQFVYLFTFETFVDFAFLMTVLPTYLALVVKSIILMFNVEEIYELLSMIQDFIVNENLEETLKKYLKRIEKVFKVFWGSAVVTTTLALGIPVFLHQLSYKMWFPYDYTKNQFLFWLSVSYRALTRFAFQLSTWF